MMKRGVEAGDLTKLRAQRRKQVDRVEVVRLVERRKRNEPGERAAVVRGMRMVGSFCRTMLA